MYSHERDNNVRVVELMKLLLVLFLLLIVLLLVLLLILIIALLLLLFVLILLLLLILFIHNLSVVRCTPDCAWIPYGLHNYHRISN